MALLDAVPFIENAYNGVGSAQVARNATVGIKNSVLARYDGVFWSPLSDSTLVLDNAFSSWRGIKSQMGGVAGNGLVYDQCQGGDLFITNSSSSCSAKNMRLVVTTEALAWASDGVPSCSGWTWTATVSYSPSGYYVWNGNSTSVGAGVVFFGTRCVK